MSQSDLARTLGCAGAQVAAWEAGTAPLPEHRRVAIAAYFGVKPGDIDGPLSVRDRAAARIRELEGQVAELIAERDSLVGELEDLRRTVDDLRSRSDGKRDTRPRPTGASRRR